MYPAVPALDDFGGRNRTKRTDPWVCVGVSIAATGPNVPYSKRLARPWSNQSCRRSRDVTRIAVCKGQTTIDGRPGDGDHHIVELSPDAVANLQSHKAGLLKRGGVLWLPPPYVRFFPGGKGRFCLGSASNPRQAAHLD